MPLFVGFFTGLYKKHKQGELKKAAEQHRTQHAELKRTRQLRIDAQNTLVSERAASLLWLQPKINAAALRLGMKKALFGPGGALGGVTLEKVRELIEKVRQALVVPAKTAVDKVVAISIGASLLLEGIEALDHLDPSSTSVLHENLNDVLSNLNVPGAEDIAHTLAELGIDTASDLLGDLLIIGGIAKGAYNLSKANEIDEKRKTVAESTDNLQRHLAKEQRLHTQTAKLNAALETRAYEAFKWTLIAETAQNQHLMGSRVARETVTTGFRRSVVALWSAHRASPEAVAA